MNFRKTVKSALPSLQMTAVMDIVFLLLCFFVTTSVYSQWENEIDITLPEAGTAETARRFPGEIVVNISAGGEVSVNGAARTEGELRRIFANVASYAPGTPVFIRADGEARYSDVVRVIDMCRAAKVENFSLAARRAE